MIFFLIFLNMKIMMRNEKENCRFPTLQPHFLWMASPLTQSFCLTKRKNILALHLSCRFCFLIRFIPRASPSTYILELTYFWDCIRMAYKTWCILYINAQYFILGNTNRKGDINNIPQPKSFKPWLSGLSENKL